MNVQDTLRRPITADALRPLVGRRVLVVAGFTVIGANGTTVVESVEEDFMLLRTGKDGSRVVRWARADSVIPFPDHD
jgi:hypothetical protein